MGSFCCAAAASRPAAGLEAPAEAYSILVKATRSTRAADRIKRSVLHQTQFIYNMQALPRTPAAARPQARLAGAAGTAPQPVCARRNPHTGRSLRLAARASAAAQDLLKLENCTPLGTPPPRGADPQKISIAARALRPAFLQPPAALPPASPSAFPRLLPASTPRHPPRRAQASASCLCRTPPR